MSRPRSGTFTAVSANQVASRFELLERIGVGGMAEIHRARLLGNEGFSKVVALKVLRPELAGDRRHVERFGMEARIGALLDHPNIASVLDFVDLNGRPTIVMEHVRGTDVLRLLATCTQQRRRLPPELCVYIAIEIARALAFAHQVPTSLAGVAGTAFLVHGDVSPANFMLAETGHVKLIDFGIADAGGLSAGPRSLRGKMGYMSPEVVLGREVDSRSDIFSLAIVLWEMLTLKRLFKSEDDSETLRNIVEVRTEGRFARHDYVPAPLLAIIARALSREPDARHQSATALAEDLNGWLVSMGLRPGPSALATFVTDISALTTGPVVVPQELSPPPGPASSLDLSGLEGLLAEIETRPTQTTLGLLANGSWRMPFSETMHRVPLDPWTFPALLARLARQGLTGALHVSDGLRDKVLFLSQGMLVHIASNVASELLGNHLTNSGLVTPDHASRGLALSHVRGMRLGEALVALRAISPEQLVDAVDEQGASRLCELMSWSQGSLMLDPGRTVEGESGSRPRSLLPLLARGIRQSFSPRRAATVLEPFADRTLSWVMDPTRIAESMGMLLPEARALVNARLVTTVGEVLAQGVGANVLALLIAVQTEGVRFL